LTSLRIDGRWKIIRGEDGSSELFNLHKDKGERNDLKDVEEGLFEEVSKQLMEASSAMQDFTPGQERLALSPGTSNKPRAMGYL
jgi:hypothetical protein